MEKQIKYNELLYIPNHVNGEYKYDGLPCPTIETFDLIGNEGVQIIHNKLAQMLEWKKVMYIHQNNGFLALEEFVDTRNNVLLAVGKTIQEKIDFFKAGFGDKYPELAISKKLKKNNYKKLMDTNHYIIDLYGDYTKFHPIPIITDDLIKLTR